MNNHYWEAIKELKGQLEGNVSLMEAFNFAEWSLRIKEGHKFDSDTMQRMWSDVESPLLLQELIKEICLRKLA